MVIPTQSGASPRRRQASEQRRRAILDAARKVFAQQGYASTVVEDIAKQADIAKGTLYLYFASKEQIYLAALLRSQLRLALGTIVTLVLTVGALPVVFWLVPSLTSRHVFGMPVSWVLLAFACYPVLVLLAWRYVRAAERNERQFTHVVERS